LQLFLRNLSISLLRLDNTKMLMQTAI